MLVAMNKRMSCDTCVEHNNFGNNFLRKHFLVCSMKLVRSWSYAFWVRNQEGFVEKLWSVRPKTATRRKSRKKKKRMAIAKLFALFTNANTQTNEKKGGGLVLDLYIFCSSTPG